MKRNSTSPRIRRSVQMVRVFITSGRQSTTFHTAIWSRLRPKRWTLRCWRPVFPSCRWLKDGQWVTTECGSSIQPNSPLIKAKCFYSMAEIIRFASWRYCLREALTSPCNQRSAVMVSASRLPRDGGFWARAMAAWSFICSIFRRDRYNRSLTHLLPRRRKSSRRSISTAASWRSTLHAFFPGRSSRRISETTVRSM